MLHTQQSFDCETVALMGRVCDTAWQELQLRLNAYSDLSQVHDLLAIRVLAAVALGERDPERLKVIALGAIDVHELVNPSRPTPFRTAHSGE
jgi:hypothetical protein